MKTFDDYLEMVDINIKNQDPEKLAEKVKQYQEKVKEHFGWDDIASTQDREYAHAYEYTWEVLEKVLGIKIYPDNKYLEDEFEELTNKVLEQLTGLRR